MKFFGIVIKEQGLNERDNKIQMNIITFFFLFQP